MDKFRRLTEVDEGEYFEYEAREGPFDQLSGRGLSNRKRSLSEAIRAPLERTDGSIRHS